MQKTVVNKIIHVPASDAWDLLSDPSGVDTYLPAISSSEVTYGDENFSRSIFLMDGGFYEETVTHVDHAKMELHYYINEPSPFPYSQLKGCIKVLAVNDTTCEIMWTCRYDVTNDLAAEINDLLTLIINYAINGVERFCSRALTLV